MSTATATPVQDAILLRDDQAGITTLTLNRPTPIQCALHSHVDGATVGLG